MDLSKYYTPHSGQLPVHQARDWAENLILEIGRRWGKSRCGIGDLMDTYLEVQQEKRGLDMVPPFHAWVVLPSFPQGRQAWHELLALIPKEMIEEYLIAEKLIWLKDLTGNWGGRPGLVELKSASDPESLQTVGLDYLWLDEAQDIENEAQEKVWPTRISAGRLGLVLATGIPSLYAEHWFRRMYLAGTRRMKEGQHRKWFTLNATAFDNPLLNEREREVIQEDREVMSESSWQRLYMARFSASAGFFRNIDACIAGDLLPGPIPGQSYVAGLDIGLAADPTVLYIMDSLRRTVVHHLEWSDTPWPTIRATLEVMNEEWGWNEFVFDASGLGGKMASQEFDQTSIPTVPFTITGEHRQDMLENLSGALERETVHFPPIKSLLRQLRSMQLRRLSSGKYQVSVPTGEHDDEIFALALCLTACTEAHTVNVVGRVGSRGRRYVPTQAEVDGAVPLRHEGAKLMRKRKDERMRQRAIAAKVEGVTT